MTSKTTVASTGISIDNLPVGATHEMDNAEALRLERLGYVRIVTQPQDPSQEVPVKKESAPKKPVTETKEEAPLSKAKPARKARTQKQT